MLGKTPQHGLLRNIYSKVDHAILSVCVCVCVCVCVRACVRACLCVSLDSPLIRLFSKVEHVELVSALYIYIYIYIYVT